MSSVAATHRPRSGLWVMVAAGGLITALSLGVRSTFGLLLEPIATGLGADLGSIALAIAVQNLLWGFSQPIAGALSDRFGAPRVLAGGGLLYALALILMSTAQGPGAILLSGGFLAGIAIGAASFAVVLSAVGRNAPPEKRSMLLGIVSAVGSLGQFVLIPVARLLLDNGSWQRAVVILGLLLVPIVAATPLMRALRITTGVADTPDDGSPESVAAAAPAPTLREDLHKARSTPSYLLLNAAFFTCGFHVTYIGVHLPGYIATVSLSPSVASNALALIGLFNVVGSLLVGWLGHRFAFTKILAVIYGLRAVGIVAYVMTPPSATTTILFGVVMGVLWLSTVPPTSAMVTEQFGPANSGALFGVVFLSHQLGSFLGAWLGGELFDLTGSYTIMWWTAAALGVFAMVMHLMISDGRDQGFGGRRRIAPAAVSALLLLAGFGAAINSIPQAAALEASSPAPGDGNSGSYASGEEGEDQDRQAGQDREELFTLYCALGPTLAHGR